MVKQILEGAITYLLNETMTVQRMVAYMEKVRFGNPQSWIIAQCQG